MGSAPEEEAEQFLLPGKESRHLVTLRKGFWLAETTVTQALWQAVMDSKPSVFQGKSLPVERVSWQDAQFFVQRLNALVRGLQARLPTEAEWEYACRAGTNTPFFFGEDICAEQVNYNAQHPYKSKKQGLYRRRTVAVKALPCNAWGLYAMHGNVWEWCQDGWQEDLLTEAVIDPYSPHNLTGLQVVRGGSWVCDAFSVRSAFRDRYFADYKGGSIGFRLAV
jgi:formylglycine-generating enzyme required for sulfatase activity